jgi:hypothetical protein
MRASRPTSSANGNSLSFTHACAYPDGTKVFCAVIVSLRNRRIAERTLYRPGGE